MAPSRLPGLLPAQLRPETVSSSSGSWRGGSGSAIGGSGGVPVIRRDPRPWVRKVHAQRVRTTIRFANPMR